jgi:hypothetical protein
VVSSNVVGYEKINLVKGYTQIGIQFQTVGAADGTIPLNSLSFSGLTGYDWDAFTMGDTLTIWDAESQAYATTYAWSGEGSEDYDVPANVWFDDSELAEADVDLPVGSSVFIKSASATPPQAVAAGEVLSDATSSISLSKGFTQFANPYPTAIKINDIAFTGLIGYDWDAFTMGDTLTIWDAESQAYATTYAWSGEGSEDYDVPANVWFDDSELAEADVTIPVGGTVFIKSASGGTATFTNPIK